VGRTTVRTELIERVTSICDMEKARQIDAKYSALGYKHIIGGPVQRAWLGYDPSRYKVIVERPFEAVEEE